MASNHTWYAQHKVLCSICSIGRDPLDLVKFLILRCKLLFLIKEKKVKYDFDPTVYVLSKIKEPNC